VKQKIQLKPELVTKTDESGRIPLHWAVSKGEHLEKSSSTWFGEFKLLSAV